MFLSLGRPGTLSTQISHSVLITVAIVVAELKQTKPQSNSTTVVFYFRPYP